MSETEESLLDIVRKTDKGAETLAVLSKSLKCKRLFKNKTASVELSVSKDLLKLVLSQKGKVLKQIEVATLDEIRKGQGTTNFLKNGRKLSVDLCFSIVYRRTRTLDLVAPSAELRAAWVSVLRVLVAGAGQMSSESVAGRRAFNTMRGVQSKGQGTIRGKDVEALLLKMNVQAKTQTIRRKMNKLGSDQLDFDGFMKFMKTLRKRKELEWLFMRFARGGEPKGEPLMSPQDLENFLHDEQHEVDVDALEIFERVTPGRKLWTHLDFEDYMASEANCVFDPAKRVIYQDMSQPLQHYYVNSSHNTCLEGDQLKSKSTAEQFVNVLRVGARCIEFDVWEGESEPQVTHGNTLCTKVPLVNVIDAVNKHCFDESPYPLIVSVENHLGVAQQKKMAKYLSAAFGDRLVLNPKGKDVVRSPEDYKGRVLLKGYPATLGPEVEEEPGAEQEAVLLSDDVALPLQDGSLASAVREDADDLEDQQQGSAPLDMSHVTGGVGSVSTSDLAAMPKTQEPRKKEKVDKSYSKLLYWDTYNTYKDLIPVFAAKKNYHMASYVEWKVEKLLQAYSLAANVAYTARFMVRVYPKGTRVDSSNYSPIPMWEMGMQCVTLNFQTTTTLPMMINHGKFLENSCGYVLKPPHMRKMITAKMVTQPILEAFQGAPPPLPHKSLRVRVFGARQLPKVKKSSAVSAFVEVVLSDVEGHRRFRTPVVKENGLNPNYNSEWSWDLKRWYNCYLTFIVSDSNSKEMLGFFSLPITCARMGYRVVPLVNEQLKPSNFGTANLLVHLSLD